MALTEDETYGTVVPGFVTDLNGNLSVTTDDTDAAWRGGKWLCDPDGRLVVTTDDTGAGFDGGFLKAPSGAVVVSTDTGASGVIPGFFATAGGALCVTNDPGDAALDTGFFRVDGALAVTGLGGGGGALYEESFDSDTGGWADVGDGDTFLVRYTGIYDTAPASLALTASFTASTYAASCPPFSLEGSTLLNVSLKVRTSGSISTPGSVAIYFADAENTSQIGDPVPIGGSISNVSSWTEFSETGIEVPEGAELASLVVDCGKDLDDPSVYIDTILVTEAA